MFKHIKLFINDKTSQKVRKDIIKKRVKERRVEESSPNDWLRSFNALMRATRRDNIKLLK